MTFTVNIEAKQFVRILRDALHIVEKPCGKLRAYNIVLCAVRKSFMDVVATEGHYLTCVTMRVDAPNDELTHEIAIPYEYVKEVCKAAKLHKRCDVICIAQDRYTTRFTIGDTVIVFSNVSITFPYTTLFKYRQHTTMECTLNVIDLVSGIGTLNKCTDCAIYNSKDNRLLRLADRHADNSVSVECSTTEKPIKDINLNPQMLLNILRQIPSKYVTIMCTDIDSPIFVMPDSVVLQAGFKACLMPIT